MKNNINLKFPSYEVSFWNKSGLDLVVCLGKKIYAERPRVNRYVHYMKTYAKNSDSDKVTYVYVKDGNISSVKIQGGTYLIAFISQNGFSYGKRCSHVDSNTFHLFRPVRGLNTTNCEGILEISLNGQKYSINDPFELEITTNSKQGIVIFRGDSCYCKDFRQAADIKDPADDTEEVVDNKIDDFSKKKSKTKKFVVDFILAFLGTISIILALMYFFNF